jgi:ATP-binding cassette, subfamily A (ABC1), member 3
MKLSNKPNHLKALLKKNFILQKRNFLSSICEILIPIIFVAGFSILKLAISTKIELQQSYIQQPY